MKRIMVFFFALICLFISPVAFAGEIDVLEQAYRDQLIGYNNEIKSLQSSVSIYGSCIEKSDVIDRKMASLYEQYRLGNLSRSDSLAPRMALLEEKRDVLLEALQEFNAAKGENRSDISIDEIKRDQEFSRRRIKEVSDKKKELKIKVLEKKGSLPSWWSE